MKRKVFYFVSLLPGGARTLGAKVTCAGWLIGRTGGDPGEGGFSGQGGSAGAPQLQLSSPAHLRWKGGVVVVVEGWVDGRVPGCIRAGRLDTGPSFVNYCGQVAASGLCA